MINRNPGTPGLGWNAAQPLAGAADHSMAGGHDPVEAYFECITSCSLDDGECVTTCTTILREHS